MMTTRRCTRDAAPGNTRLPARPKPTRLRTLEASSCSMQTRMKAIQPERRSASHFECPYRVRESVSHANLALSYGP